MSTFWTVCTEVNTESMWQLVKADGFTVSPDGQVTFWIGSDTVAYFARVISITKGLPEDGLGDGEENP